MNTLRLTGKVVPKAVPKSSVRATPAKPTGSRSRAVVSSSHLVSPRSVELSEFEFGMIVAWNAFSRWRCAAWRLPAAPT